MEIASGVTEGQRVVISGQYGLPDGTKVQVQRAPGQNAPAETPATAAETHPTTSGGSAGASHGP